MASTQNVKAVNLIAGEDLNGDFAEILILNASGQVVKPTATTGVVDEVPIGILAEDPGRVTVAGVDSVPVVLLGGGGVMKVKAGGVITSGDIVTVDATSGRVASAGQNPSDMVDTEVGIGYALETAADGDIFEMLAQPVYRSNDAA